MCLQNLKHIKDSTKIIGLFNLINLWPAQFLFSLKTYMVDNALSHFIRKPVYAIYKQQRCRSACASAQSDQRLCCSLSRQYNTYNYYSRNSYALSRFYSWAGWFETPSRTTPNTSFLVAWLKWISPITEMSFQCMYHQYGTSAFA